MIFILYDYCQTLCQTFCLKTSDIGVKTSGISRYQKVFQKHRHIYKYHSDMTYFVSTILSEMSPPPDPPPPPPPPPLAPPDGPSDAQLALGSGISEGERQKYDMIIKQFYLD